MGVSRVNKFDKVAQSAEPGVDTEVVRYVVTVIQKRGRMKRQQPKRVETKAGDIDNCSVRPLKSPMPSPFPSLKFSTSTQ